MNCPTKNPLRRDGTSQHQRMLEALDPSHAPIHEFSIRDWMFFAWQYAHSLNFYNVSNSEAPQSDWSSFIPEEKEIKKLLEKFQKQDADANMEPHLALFFSFLKLMQQPHGLLNTLTKKHLDFYYKRVLQLKKRGAVADKVHLVFELAKNIVSYQFEKDALFDAGKDKGEKPKPLNYIIRDEPAFYHAKTEAYKAVYHQKGKSLHYASIANSYNGSGAALDKENPVWYAFGFDRLPLEKDSETFITLPAAKLGLALASPVMLLKEGERTITVTLHLSFPAGTNYTSFASLQDHLVILLTGEKQWISPSKLTVDKLPSAADQKLKFTATIDSAEKAIAGYDAKLHAENFNTTSPVMRILMETGKGKAYKAYRELTKATLKKATIHIDVKGMKDVIVENDDGKLDPAKPFLPFGAVPKKGSNFYVGSEEIFQKEWGKVHLNVEWKNKPGSLRDHYKAYQLRFLGNNFTRNTYNLTASGAGGINNIIGTDIVVKGDNYFKVESSYIKNNRWSDAEEIELFDSPLKINNGNNITQNFKVINFGFSQLYATQYTPAVSYIQNYLQATPVLPAFTVQTFNPGFAVAAASIDRFTAGTKNGFLRFKLVNDFFHGNYPVLYAAALTIPGAVVPKEPYTPAIASLSIDYSAVVENDFSIGNESADEKLRNYRDRNIQLFHEGPFGQSEQHRFLKEQQKFISDKVIYAVPQYVSEGEFYIGVKDLLTETILSILFQVAEGSENPEAQEFDKKKQQEIQWHVLCNNEWKYLNDNFIISDDTNNFLRSGIIQFLVPEECMAGNTILPKEYSWLRAQLPEGIQFDSVCKFVDVIAQASVADFQNNDNDLSHLETALKAGSISKMVNRHAAVKQVLQPFNSFGGLPEETDTHFYIRVSERLRHKNRAVNIWDYERLVLEKFPSVYKVKCLNHTSDDFELAPGFVRMILIPDLRNKNIYDVYQPRVSKNMLSEIQNFLNGLHGFHVDCKAMNPEYEEVKFDFRVKFHEGRDPKTYTKRLNEELKKYLSPWAFDEYAALQFGGSLHKSRVIAFIDERHYVDFITDFRMYHIKFGKKDCEEIMADGSSAILTSVKKHAIESIQPPVCP